MALTVDRIIRLEKTIAPGDGADFFVDFSSGTSLIGTGSTTSQARTLLVWNWSQGRDNMRRQGYRITPNDSGSGSTTFDRIRVRRFEGTNSDTTLLVCYVIEFTDGKARVRHATQDNLVATSTSIPNTAFGMGASEYFVADAVPFISWQSDIDGWRLENSCTASVEETTGNRDRVQVDVQNTPASGNLSVAIQVLEILEGASVETGEITLTGSSPNGGLGPETATVTPGTGFVVIHTRCAGTNDAVDKVWPRHGCTAEVTGSTISVERAHLLATYDPLVRWYWVRFTDGTNVETGETVVTAGNATPTANPTLAVTDINACVPMLGDMFGNKRQSGSNSDCRDALHRLRCLNDGSDDVLEFGARSRTFFDTTTRWYVVEWQEPGAPPTGNVADVLGRQAATVGSSIVLPGVG